MAKNKITDFSTSDGENTDVKGVNIGEGMAPGGVNNGMRGIMATIADAFALANPGTKLTAVKSSNYIVEDGDTVTLGSTDASTLSHTDSSSTSTVTSPRTLDLKSGAASKAGEISVTQYDETLGFVKVLSQTNAGGLAVGNAALNTEKGASYNAMTVTGTLEATKFVGDGSGLTNIGTTDGVVPTGAIVMWAGSVASIPSGWALCDGTNGTPNLVDKFIKGTSGTPGSTGGSNDRTLVEGNLPSHSHSAGTIGSGHTHANGTLAVASHSHSAGSLSVDSHNHSMTHNHSADTTGLSWTNINNAGFNGGGPWTAIAGLSASGSQSVDVDNYSGNTGNDAPGISGSTASAPVSMTGSISASGTLTGTSGTAGSGTSFDNQPAFYTLAFIQFTGA